MEMNRPRRVGFWRKTAKKQWFPPVAKYLALAMADLPALQAIAESGLPHPLESIDPAWRSTDDYRCVLEYLQQPHNRNPLYGFSTCRICGCENGVADVTDGEWLWPEGFAHYIEAHGVKPPEDFIEHCRVAQG